MERSEKSKKIFITINDLLPSPSPPRRRGWGRGAMIKEKLGNLSSFAVANRSIDTVLLEWHECDKRILHKRTKNGKDITLKFLKEMQNLQQDDVLYADETLVIVVDVLPCEAIVLRPSTLYEMALVCYEIGNKHLPLFYEGDTLLVPFDKPLYNWLIASGFEPVREERTIAPSLAHHGCGTCAQ